MFHSIHPTLKFLHPNFSYTYMKLKKNLEPCMISKLNKNRGFSAKNPKTKKINGRGFFLALASCQAAAALMPNQERCLMEWNQMNGKMR